MKFRLFFVFLFTALLAGCLHQPYISQDGLKAPSTNVKPIELTQDVSIPTRLGLNFDLAVLVTKGVYVPVLEDDEGIYYKGPDDCVQVVTVVGGKVANTMDGGLWVPKSNVASKQLKIYSHEFSGKQYRTPVPVAQGTAGKSDVAAATINTAMVTAPAGASPVAAGATGGVVGGLLGALIEDAKIRKRMVLMTDALPYVVLEKALKKEE
ncbi:hypothetical protein [Undibacterium luofuense]|uniref:Lipoprotein n=1 Tax=Undibacterium luofuense TaxID=2828733 RepID=A0A941DPJ8_9BURK|nr:hypothetical protein [Undibacterium luofuense]MBR7783824.1 hypothetical protein [Undibacterium luofuense]